VSANEKIAKFGQKGSRGSHVTNIGFLAPPYISGMNEAKNLKFGTEMDGSEY